MLDGIVLGAFLVGLGAALVGRPGRAWPAVAVIVGTGVLGLRGLYLLEQDAPGRAAWTLGLFALGLAVAAWAARRAREEGKGNA